jgi:hypothetical protein
MAGYAGYAPGHAVQELTEVRPVSFRRSFVWSSLWFSSSFCRRRRRFVSKRRIIHRSIDRSTVVVSRYWTPRATGERKRGGGVVARVARTLSNNTNNLLVVIHHSSETKSVARGGIGRGFGNAGKTLWKRGEKSVGEEIQTSKI